MAKLPASSRPQRELRDLRPITPPTKRPAAVTFGEFAPHVRRTSRPQLRQRIWRALHSDVIVVRKDS